jgi:sulfofructose kinase
MAREPGVIDVLGMGIVTVDDFLYVPAYPAADAKVRVSRRLRQCGGLTGTALVAAARQGARAAYAGCLGDDELSDFIHENFRAEGIDTSFVDALRTTRPIHSTIVVDESTGTRAILFQMPDDPEFGGEWPPEAVVRSARVLFVDHYDSDRTIRAAKIARSQGIPVVADFERDEGPRFAELLAVADHLIVSRSFGAKITGESDPRRIVECLMSAERKAVVITCGEDGCWHSVRPSAPAEHHPAFPIKAVDTTGCGDVFHGAYAASLAREEPMLHRIAMASAAAAIKAKSLGGQAGIPTHAEVKDFLRRSGS